MQTALRYLTPQGCYLSSCIIPFSWFICYIRTILYHSSLPLSPSFFSSTFVTSTIVTTTFSTTHFSTTCIPTLATLPQVVSFVDRLPAHCRLLHLHLQRHGTAPVSSLPHEQSGCQVAEAQCLQLAASQCWQHSTSQRGQHPRAIAQASEECVEIGFQYRIDSLGRRRVGGVWSREGVLAQRVPASHGVAARDSLRGVSCAARGSVGARHRAVVMTCETYS